MKASDWLKDLQALAAARRDTGASWFEQLQQLGAARSANDAAQSRLSFADDCDLFQRFAERGVDSRVEASLSELRLVSRIMNTVAEIIERLEATDPLGRSAVLREYGLQPSMEVDVPGLERMRAATEELRSNLNPAVWFCSGRDERQEYANEAQAALQRFLAACH